MAENNNDKLVIAYYVNSAAANAAADDLKDWDKDNDDIKLGAIGVITIDEHSGEVVVDEIGSRHTKRGAAWGTAIGAGLGILTAGIALIPGMIVGAAVGGGLGHFNHKSLGMTDEDVANLAAHLKHGGAALGVMCDDFEVAATKAKMLVEGGKTELYSLDDKTAVEIYAMTSAQVEASRAVDAAMESEGDGAAEVLAAVGAEEEEIANLGDAGLTTASSLLEMGATPAGRKELSDATGFSEAMILAAVRKMDLMRIKGVGKVYADLLIETGIDSVPDLAQREAVMLHKRMSGVNDEKQISDVMPSEETVGGWIIQAKDMPVVIVY